MTPDLPKFTPPPSEGDTSAMDRALAEARDDAAKLLAWLRTRTPDLGVDVATSRLVQGLLDDPMWGRLELASVLGAALAQIVGADR